MLDLLDEVNRAVCHVLATFSLMRTHLVPQNEWTRKNITSLRRSFDLVDNPRQY